MLVFWKLCLVSVFLHGALITLPLPKPDLQRAEESSGDEAPAAEAALSLAMTAVSLPPDAPVSKNAAVSELAGAEHTTNSSVGEDIAAALPAQQLVKQPVEQSGVIAQPVQPPVQPSPTEQLTHSQPDEHIAPMNELLLQPSLQPSIQSENDTLNAVDTETTTDERLSPLGAAPEYGKVMPLSEVFPDLAGARSGCYGLSGCRQVDENYRRAAQELIAQLEEQGYRVTQREDIDETGHRVFEVVASEEPDRVYYLNIFSPDLGSTVYALTTEVLSLDVLRRLSG